MLRFEAHLSWTCSRNNGRRAGATRRPSWPAMRRSSNSRPSQLQLWKRS